MQICLHSRHNKGNTRKICTAAVILCITALAAVLIWKVSEEKPVVLPENSMYLSTNDIKAAAENNTASEEKHDEKVKMNNSKTENSIFEENAVTSNLPHLSYVRVADKSGEVKNMSLEDYVYGCLLAEMPLDFHPQALMAQAVAVRTYAAEKILCGKSKHKNFDLCMNSGCCQSFAYREDKAYSEELLQKARDAVNATKGMIAVYEGKPINAVYHASSGLYTLDSEKVWGGTVPYLRSVKAPNGESELSKRVYTYDEEAFCRMIGAKESDGTVQVFSNSAGESTVSAGSGRFTEKQVAKALGLAEGVEIKKDGNSITVTAFGYGHRVGMSQHGANLLAKEGKSCTDILSYYYTGISFDFVEC